MTFEVTVLTSARTYSAGFDMAAMLYKHGATIVGAPSSQAGNCFIDTLRYTDHLAPGAYLLQVESALPG
ncbi:MAG: hypothetical protein R2849_23720 [Thermomicrobiales bacterium]